ncbi:hypothetical protein [Cellulomonas sp. URHE0023]|uniref:hypothetical protein n=1 Tax=Cellulomonas sp. URHE0023 TaxID=1380354 RepID=UPI000489F17D|nr:hypothetical protein [Cellulomonas sp. URHE0023]
MSSGSWATLTDEALADEIEANGRTERRLLVGVAVVAAVCTVAVLVLHGPVTSDDVDQAPGAHSVAVR